MPHYCHLCGRDRRNAKFSGTGHRRHVCRDRTRLPRAERQRRQLLYGLRGYWFQSNLSEKNRTHLEALGDHPDSEIRDLAAVLHRVAFVHPHRRRLKRLRREHPELWGRLVALGLLEEWPACAQWPAYEEGGPGEGEDLPWPEGEVAFGDDGEDADDVPF